MVSRRTQSPTGSRIRARTWRSTLHCRACRSARRNVPRYRRRDARFAHRRIGEGDVEVVDVLAELPLEPAPLPLPEQIGLVEAEEAADARPLPHRGAEVDVAGALLGDAEHHVDVALLVGRL